MDSNEIIIKIIKKETGELIGYKLDTFWSLGDKKYAKKHNLFNSKIEQHLITNLAIYLQKDLKNNVQRVIDEYNNALICYELNNETFPQILIKYDEINMCFTYNEYTRKDLAKEKLTEILKKW